MKQIKEMLVVVLSVIISPAISMSQCPLEKSIYGGFHWSLESKPALFGDNLGASLFNIGDIDNDGANDFAAAAYRDIASAHFSAAIKIWSGKNKNLITTFKTELLPIEGFFGGNIIPAGDLDGDGFGDILITQTRVNFFTQHRGEISAYSLNPSPKLIYNIKAPQILESSGGYDSFGDSAISLGDLNGDGIPEFAVSADSYNDSDLDYDNRYEGVVFIYNGANGGLLNFFNYDSSEISKFGNKLYLVSDITGDGIKDLAVRAEYSTQEGSTAVLIFYNGALLTNTNVNSRVTELVPDVWNDDFADALINVGDYNSDGISEIAISQAGYDVGKTEPVLIYSPKQSGANITFSVIGQFKSIDTKDAYFGNSMALLKDYDNDGKGEIAISSPFIGYGKVEIFSSSTGGILQTLTSVKGDKYGAEFGRELTLLGDTNLDGYDELAIAAPGSFDGVDYSSVGINFTTGRDPEPGAIEIFSISFDKNSNGTLDACEIPIAPPTSSTPQPNQTAAPGVSVTNIALNKPTFKVNGKKLEIYMDSVSGAKYNLTYTVKLPKSANGKVKKPKTKTVKVDSSLYSFKLPKVGSSVEATYSVYTDGVSASQSKESPKGKIKIKALKKK